MGGMERLSEGVLHKLEVYHAGYELLAVEHERLQVRVHPRHHTKSAR